MHLGHCGTSLELRVAGYQFPDLEPGRAPGDGASFDANWLVVTGEVRTADGTSWAFRKPTLMTWEVMDLVSWLRKVANGAVPVAPTTEELAATIANKYTPAGWLTFTEPNLSFAVGGYAGSQVELLVGLSHGFAAPSINRMRLSKRSQIAVVTDRQQVEYASDALQRQLVTYPIR